MNKSSANYSSSARPLQPPIAKRTARTAQSQLGSPQPTDPKPKPQDARHKEYFCRFCDKRATSDVPPGWYSLRRRIVPGSLGPHLPPKRNEQPMGLYCSLNCLISAIPRLLVLDANFTQRGVGLKPLAAGEQPPVIQAPASRGGPQ
jgi:hypothetical protein